MPCWRRFTRRGTPWWATRSAHADLTGCTSIEYEPVRMPPLDMLTVLAGGYAASVRWLEDRGQEARRGAGNAFLRSTAARDFAMCAALTARLAVAETIGVEPATGILFKRWPAVTQLAAELARRRRLDAAEICAALADGPDRARGLEDYRSWQNCCAPAVLSATAPHQEFQPTP